MKEIRVALVGAGNIAHCHIAAYKRLSFVRTVCVCDINRERAEAFAREFCIERVYDRLDEMLEKEELDAVSVCTWNSAHAPVTLACLRRGLNVLCEKPLAMNAREAQEMCSAARQAGKLLMPGFCTRYEEGPRLLRQRVQAGDLGEIYYLKATYLRRHGYPGGWFGDGARSGGGPVIDLGVHVLDLARFILGGSARAVSVSALTRALPPDGAQSASPHKSAEADGMHNVEDFAAALVRFEGGACALLETSWNHYTDEDSFQLEAYGTRGGAKIYPRLKWMRDLDGVPCDVQFRHTNHEDQPNYDFDEEIAHFLRASQGTEVPVCTAGDGLEIMRIVDALYLSARSGREEKIAREETQA